jgi:hypothetical protein
MRYILTGARVLYITQKLKDSIGNIATPRVRWSCVSSNLHMVFEAYEPLESRPGISILLSMAYRFRSINSYIKYLRLLAKNPRNVHAAWLLSRLYLVREYIDDPASSYDCVNTVILNRDMRGTYLAMLLIVNAMCNDESNDVIILDDITTLPIREDVILRIIRVTRGLMNTWIVMHSIGDLSTDELNTPTIITSHSGLSKIASKYRDIFNTIDENEALYIGVRYKLKINLNHVREIRSKLIEELNTKCKLPASTPTTLT